MKKTLLFILLCSLFIQNINSQEYYELEEMFLDADSWFYYEDYKEALPIFLRVLEADSLNYNVMFKIGYCYLNIPGQKAKSIPYLEQASRKTTPNYNDNTYTERLAPVDAYFYLGNAYLVNNRIDEAIDAYTGFQNAITRTKKLANKDIYDTDYLTRQFDACRNAIQFKNQPISFIASNVGSKINSRFNEFNAVVSGDGNSMVFTASLQFYDAIFYAKKQNGQWGYPINIMGQLGIDDNSASTGLSYDGTELYVYRDDDFDGNIYVSYLKDGLWTKVRKLGPEINTKYWESHASLSPDGKKLYFVSNRPEGYGDLDIYVAERTSDTTWGMPRNLGDKINTRWNENTPFLTPDGKRLFFSSEGLQGMGGYDIYYSTLENNEWSEPVNIGYPINTTDDDIFFVPFEKGKFAYCSQFSSKGYGGQDIYHFQVFHIPEYSNIMVEGVLTMDNKTNRKKEQFVINIIDKNSKDTIITLNPDTDKQNYTYRTPLGKNHLVYESTMEEENGAQYFISTDYNIKELFQSEIEAQRLAELEKNKPNILLTQEQFFVDTDNENVRIKLSLQKGNKLVVNTYYKDQLINTEEFDIDKEDFIYEYKPLIGESKIQFKLIDKNNNVKSEEVSVSYIPKDMIAELNVEGQTVTINENGEKNVKIKLKVEKGSKLIVETFVDGKLINTENFDIKKQDFTYEFAPKGDKTKLNFKLVDKHNNVANQQVIVSQTAVSNDLADILKNVYKLNIEELSDIIQSKEILSASSISDLIQLLYIKGAEKGLSKEQIQALLIALAINADPNTEKFILNLRNLANGDLKYMLDSAYNYKSNYTNNLSVVEYLNRNAGLRNYNHKDVVMLLERYLINSGISTSEFITQLNKLLESDYAKLLTSLDASATNIVTLEHLKKYLEAKGIYPSDKLLQWYALFEGINISMKASGQNETEIKDVQLAEKQDDKKSNSVILFSILSVFVLAIIIIYFNRRKNKGNKKRSI